MRINVALPGFHRVERGAELALEAVAGGLVGLGHDVTLYGGGHPRPGRPYDYHQRGLVDRRRFERFPRVAPLRSAETYEELTFALGGARHSAMFDADVTITCGYPFTNWLLTRSVVGRRRPAHVFVTENGDHPATSTRGEFGRFRCDGLVCTNPQYADRNRYRWNTALIPNGIDPDRFAPGAAQRSRFNLPDGVPVVLIASALIESKRVVAAVRAVAAIPDAYLVIAGDGPLRDDVDELCAQLVPSRHRRIVVPAAQMPDLYRSVDVLVHMSGTESFGNVYLEALCCGLPIIADDYGVTRWILGADYPGLVDTNDLGAVSVAAAKALRAGREPVAEHSASARRRFSWSSVATQYDGFLHAVVGPRSRRWR
ncbi:MAG: glycosyltransferase family 4 protein [Ilumatobacteraceae bacterium]